MTLDLEKVKKKVKSNQAILYDVREQEEWEIEHFSLAEHLPLSELRQGNIPENLPQETPLYIHCQKGVRAKIAQDLLLEKYPLTEALECSFEDLKKEFSSD